MASDTIQASYYGPRGIAHLQAADPRAIEGHGDADKGAQALDAHPMDHYHASQGLHKDLADAYEQRNQQQWTQARAMFGK